MSTRSIAADRWRTIIRRQQSSGSSVAAFCRRAGVSQASFYARRQKLRGEVPFAEVKLPSVTMLKSAGVAATDEGGIELRLPGRRSIVVQRGFDRQTLLELLSSIFRHDIQPGQLDVMGRLYPHLDGPVRSQVLDRPAVVSFGVGQRNAGPVSRRCSASFSRLKV